MMKKVLFVTLMLIFAMVVVACKASHYCNCG